MKKLTRYIPLMLLVAMVILCACSAKKNTSMSRFWQGFTTRYNVYYNGKTNYDEQIKILENDYQDDYSQHLFVHPSEAHNYPKSPQPGGSFDRTIEKMQKAISLHSIKKKPKKKAGKGNDPKYKEYLKRDEYNPFLHNAWYLMAKAEYMKGDFLSASATFHYITRHFTWKEELVQESSIWEALCYCAMGWTTEADNVLAHVHIDKIESKRLRSLANLAFADYYIKSQKYEEAIPYLAEAAKHFGGAQGVRLNFLLGQLYEESGQKDLAYQAYKKAGSNSGSTYRTKFNCRIKQSACFSGSDIKSEVNALKRMTHYDRNKEYLDQVYYAIGNLYMTKLDTLHAIDAYKMAAEKSTRNGIDKAISQLQLGGIYFAQRKYDLAQPCYAEAIPQLSEDYPNYKELKKRSDVLDELAVYSQNVTLQDSLLKLSQLPLEEQKKVIKKIIDDLKKKEKEEADNAKREEYLAQQNAQGSQTGKTNANAPASYSINNDKSWYFYNTATKNAGKTAFQQQWGNRKLEDNWRRRNKNTFSLDDDNSGDAAASDTTNASGAPGDTTKMDKEALKRSEDPHYEEYYLKQIPSTPEQIQNAHDIIQEGLFNMGTILKDKLEDMEAAKFEFNELLRRYPDNTYRLDTYYNMYLICMRQNDPTEAETWRQKILTDFADSKYGQAMQDPNYLDNLKRMNEVQEEMYEKAYAAYLNDNNDAVHEAYAEMMRKYPLSKLMPKFMFIDALSYVTQKKYDKFKEVLKEMLERYPETDITPTASAIVKQINQGRKLNGGGSNARGMSWNTFSLGNDSTAGANEKQLTPFKDGVDKPQVFVLVFSNDSINSNMLLYEVARHNFNSFNVRDYDLEQMTFGNMGLLIVKGFANYNELLNYHTVFEADKSMQFGPLVHQVLISEENFNLLLNEGRSFEDYFRYLDEQNEEQVEAKVPETAEDDAKIEKEGEQKADDGKPKKSVRDNTVEKKAQKEAEKKAEEKKNEEKKEEKPSEKQEEKKAEPAAQPEVKPEEKKPEEKKAEEKKEETKKEEEKKEETKKEEEKKTETKKQAVLQPKPAAEASPEAQVVMKKEEVKKPVVTVENPDLVVDDGSIKTNSASKQKPLKKNPTQTAAPQPAETETSKAEDAKSTKRDEHKQAEQTKKQEEQARKDAEKAEKERIKAEEKAEKERIKAEEKAAKEREKREKQAAKDAEKMRQAAEKAQQDSIKAANAAEKARLAQLKAQQDRDEKAAKQAQKDAEKAAKEAEKSRAKAEKEAEKMRKAAEKAQQDSIKNVQKLEEKRLREEQQAKEDSAKAAQEAREQAAKDAVQAKKDALKAKEQERKQKQKEREELAKQKQKEREQRAKEREQQAKQKQKEREELAKQKQKEREAIAKQKEEERKLKEKERKEQAKLKELERKLK